MRPSREADKADLHRRISSPNRQGVAEIAQELGSK